MVLLLIFELGSSSFTTFAAGPSLDHFFPVALQLGTTNAVTAIGKFDPWPVKVWVDAPGIEFRAETNAGNFSITIAPDAPIGPHLVRVFNEQGASGPRFLLVTREPQFAEQEPNDDFSKPQIIENFPVWINGRLEKSGDVDCFAVKLNAGQTIIAALEAYTLASPLDAVLRLVDARGVEVAFNHDDGRTLDPFLAWTAKQAGIYVLQVFGFAYPADSTVAFTGNSKCVYRLHLSHGPWLRHTLPLGVQRGMKIKLHGVGWNFGSNSEPSFEFDGSSLPSDCEQTKVRFPGFDNEVVALVGDGVELEEQEPNDSLAEANALKVPGAVTGSIGRVGDEDRFRFVAKKGERLWFQIHSSRLGFPLDAWLKIEDAGGKSLARSDENSMADPELEWTAPEDGSFVTAVGSVLHRGGFDHRYRLSVTRTIAGIKAVVAADAFVLEAGKTNEIKVTVTRQFGFAAKLQASAKDLPVGISVAPVDAPEKNGDVTLKLVANADAKPFSGPFEIVVSEVQSKREHVAAASLVTTGINNGVPNGYSQLVIESVKQLWLTVTSPPAKAEEPKK
ncbi:MAG: PPC domain-containing protein [Verrucomicrobia bacterium]|nr:PPC domain-containing protein [Verrucomicrobiota bacterium]